MLLEDAALFDSIVGRYHAGTPITPQQQPGTAHYAAGGGAP
jgi:hypothetical protein